MNNPFINEHWQNLSNYENNEREEKKKIMVCKKLRRMAKENKEIKDIMESFNPIKDAISYVRIINKLNNLKEKRNLQNMDPKEIQSEIQSADFKKKLAHNSLVDSLNILSRMCGKLGLDTNWRQDIGDTRKAVSDWALVVSKNMQKQIEGDFLT